MPDLKVDQVKLEEMCRKYQVEFLGVFGSVARGQQRSESDVDLLVRFSPDAKIGYFKLYEIEKNFSKILNNPVDLVTEESLSPYIKDRVFSDLRPIYGNPR